ncbi:hypothetical protein [Roseomonas sp. HF4]|uniref:hypothetical protein n=1 Tax=Roseomonas sp. HF4 TaxID=2562313 RepID=UPI0010C15026|nr:hypothetical protein [Roseomonas sp. HF4]
MAFNILAQARIPSAAPALVGLLLLAGCGTAHIQFDNRALDGAQRPEAWNGTIVVASEPAGARCVVTREGAQVAEIAATPANVTLARGNSPAEVRCAAPGRLETTATLRPLRDFGVQHHQPTGPVGAVNHRIDRETGRVRRFYDVTVALPPASFSSAEARDAWFAGRAQTVRADWALHIGRAERSSEATIDTAETLRGYLAADLAALDRQKAAATVATSRRGR